MIARIRTVKPELFQHGSLYDLEQTTGLPLRLAFIGLWSLCDREGRFDWKPREMKLSVLPYDPVDFGRVLDALATRAFVVRYAVAGREYGWVPRFLTHQQINNRETPSVLPDPPADLVKAVEDGTYAYSGDAWVTRAPRVKHARPTPHKGKGTEQNRTELRESWLTPFSDAWARTRGQPPFGRLAKAIGGLITEHGKRQVLLVWLGYLEERRDKGFCTPEDFAGQYEFYRRKWAVEINEVGEEIPVPDEPEAAA